MNSSFITTGPGRHFWGLNWFQTVHKMTLAETELKCHQKCAAEYITCINFALKQNGISHSYHSDQSMSVLRIVGLYFSFSFVLMEHSVCK